MLTWLEEQTAEKANEEAIEVALTVVAIALGAFVNLFHTYYERAQWRMMH